VIPALLASIPSPDSGAIHIGPLQLRAYGLMIALGVIAAVWLTGKRIVERRIGKAEDASAIALWAVPAGIIGARIYHVITDPELFKGQWYRVFYIWEGGLGIWGGIGLGVAVGLWVAHRRGIPLLPLLDAVAPGLALAQAIGRWGNYWNQELFGRPTTLPWGLEIDVQNRPDGYTQYATFHPTFLYESLWNLALCGLLLLIDRRHRLRPGRLFVLYVAGYTLARFFIERIRIDTANKILGLRVNEWVSALIFLAAAGYLAVDAWRHRGEPVPGTESEGTTEPPAEEGVDAAADAVTDPDAADAVTDPDAADAVTDPDAADAVTDPDADAGEADDDRAVTDDISSPDPASSS
jgi:prolipoprotein diacylglyceryl transferase